MPEQQSGASSQAPFFGMQSNLQAVSPVQSLSLQSVLPSQSLSVKSSQIYGWGTQLESGPRNPATLS